MKLKFWFVLACVFGVLRSYAQEYRPGYIILPKGDTLRGQVRYTETAEAGLSACFRADTRSTIQCYQPTELRGYGLEQGRQYRSVTLQENTNPVFAQLLSYGRAVLYKHNGQYFGGRSGDRLFELTAKDTTIIRNDKRFKIKDRKFARLLGTYILADCPSVQAPLERASLRDSDLSRLFNLYNRCFPDDKGNQPVPALTRLGQNEPLFRIKRGFGLGWRLSSMKARSGYEGTGYSGDFVKMSAQKAYRPAPTLWMVVKMPHFSERLALQTGLSFSAESFSGHLETVRFQSTTQEDFWFQYAGLHLPLLLRYERPVGRVTAHIAAGPGFSGVIWSDESYRRETKVGSVVNQWQGPFVQVRPVTIYYQGSAGVTFPLSKRWSLLVEGRYDWMPRGITQTSVIYARETRFRTIQLSVGLLSL